MLNFENKISDFLKDTIMPGTPDNFTYEMDTKDILDLLFQTFPKDCIDDYELFNILIDQGFKQYISKTGEAKDTDKPYPKTVWFIEIK